MQRQAFIKTMILVTAIFTLLSSGCASRIPGVAPGDSSQSFFADQVTYPFKVHYADVKSNDGTVWNIGYMDVGPWFRPNPKVLVLIHGRACSGAYFGHIAKTAAQRGIRVIVPDLPNYGKSIPGNLDNSPLRSMQQAREAIHDLVVNHLQISKAVYGGHSLGGQFVLGYALSYPEAVGGLILVSPAGLEELPQKFFPPDLATATDPKIFSRIPYYAPKARLDFSTKAKLIEDFYNYRLVINGKRIPSGFFKKETPDTRLATAIRTGMINGNPKEFRRYSVTSLRDVYNLGIEIRKEDPDSLFKHYVRIQAPILLIFGDKEPFFPKKISGLKDLKRDMIKPFYDRMTAAGCSVAFKFYPDCGHFPHNDRPDRFADDVVAFVTAGRVSGTEAP